ncbi:hypothetical protein ACNIZK_21400, partial [Citrobacter portucalensis]
LIGFYMTPATAANKFRQSKFTELLMRVWCLYVSDRHLSIQTTVSLPSKCYKYKDLVSKRKNV